MNGYTLSDYALTGRVTYQHSVIGMTLDNWKVRHTVTYTDIGKPAPITPIDPDDPHPAPIIEGGHKLNSGPGIAEKLCDALAKHGPVSPAQLVNLTGEKRDSIHAAFRRNADKFVRLTGGQGRHDTTWGLVGVHDGKGA